MILIISKNTDFSTNDVLNWFLHYRIPFIRVNEDDYFKFIEIIIKENGNSFILDSETSSINSDAISGFWYRRGELNLTFDYVLSDRYKGVENILKSEFNAIKEEIYSKLESKKKINGYSNRVLNKLSVLRIANLVKLKTPITFIMSGQRLSSISGSFITKSITDYPPISINQRTFSAYTSVLKKEVYLSTVDFFPTLIQEQVQKEFEIRSYYLDGKFYSMAIFSQSDERTKIDFKRYNRTKPNRVVPFKLPKQIEVKLVKLFNRVNLNSGSVDLIYTINKEFIFLEVNPVGQFAMVSDPCNYFIEREIAKYFML